MKEKYINNKKAYNYTKKCAIIQKEIRWTMIRLFQVQSRPYIEVYLAIN